MSWSDPCNICDKHRADCECRDYTQQEKDSYLRYVDEWSKKYKQNNNSPDWSISNNIGDPFSIKEWLDKPYLHNF